MAVEPVRRTRLLFRRRPRRDDAQIAIDLHGIGVDDDAAGLLRQFERQGRLAAGGRPCDKHGLAPKLANSPACPLSPPSSATRPIRHSTAPSSTARWPFSPRPVRRDGCSTRSQSTFPSTIRSIALTTSRRSKPACKRRAATCRSTLSCSLRATRRKKLFLADMDSTMIGQECIDELADFAGLKAHVAGDHRTGDARRNRIRTSIARARGAAEGSAGRRRRRGAGKAHHADAGRPRTGHDHACQWRLHLPDLRRLHAVHQRGRRHDRLPGEPRQPTRDRERQADRRSHRADRRPRRQTCHPDRAHAKVSTSTTSTRW